MSIRNHLLQVLHEQQNIIELQSRLIVDLTETLESWESVTGYDGTGLKERVLDMQERKGRIYGNESDGDFYGNESDGIYQRGGTK